MQFEDGPSAVFAAPATSLEEAPEGEAQRKRAIKVIAAAALAVTMLYSVGYGLMGWWYLLAYSGAFVLWYGAVYYGCARGRMRLAGIALIGGGTLQLCGISLLFLPATGGTQIFISLLPIFALVAISPRDWLWSLVYTVVTVGFLTWMEYGRGTYVPIMDVGMEAELASAMRPAAVAITVLMMVGVFNAFLGDLRLARKRLAHAHEQSELLLLNILPASIAHRLKTHQEVTIADDYPEASVLFADLVGFTKLSSGQSASETVVMLNGIFSAFDVAVVAHGLEKIKTIGDGYMVASGVPVRRRDHVTQLLALALTMERLLAVHNMRHGYDLELRIGVHTGPLTAGVIGSRKFTYDIWGDTVNMASRMESTGIPGRIQVSEAVTKAAAGHFEFEDRGLVEIKGKGEMHTFLVVPPA